MSKKKILIYKRGSEIVLSANTNFITQPAQIQWKKEVFSKEELPKGKIRHVWRIVDNGELIGEGTSIKYKFIKSDENKYVKFYAMVSKFQSIEQSEIFYVESEHDTGIRVTGVDSDKEEVMIGERVILTVEYSDPKRVSEKTKDDVKWMVRIDNGTDERLIVDDIPIMGGEVSFVIPSEWKGKIVMFMPYLKKYTPSYFAKISVASLPIVIDRYKMPGLNKEGTDIADDMTYGYGVKQKRPIYEKHLIDSYKESYKDWGFDPEIHCTFLNSDESTVCWKSIYNKADFPGVAKILHDIDTIGGLRSLTDKKLFDHFKDMIGYLFTSYFNRKMKNVAFDMVDRFQSNTGGVYENQDLTDDIKDHDSTIRFCEEVEGYIRKALREHDGDLSKLEDKKVYFNTKRELQEKKNKFESLTPLYPVKLSREGIKNVTQGRTITLNDIWATEILLTSYERTQNKYNLKYKVTLYDHFGLDLQDIKAGKFAGWVDGFRYWFILQHLRGYKPFVTKITFERELKGNI